VKVNQLARVRRIFDAQKVFVSPEMNRANQRKWVAAVRMLGDRWLLAQNLTRKDNWDV
jgi:hypothetical protein